MPEAASLDAAIAESAAAFTVAMAKASKVARKEEEIRIATERQLALIQEAAGITLEGHHEFTVASGRVDSVYERVLIEYKNPSGTGSRIGPTSQSPGSRKLIAQIQRRFTDLQADFGHELHSLLGVGLDGRRFIFVRFREGRFEVQEPVEVSVASSTRFLWALFNLGRRGKPFDPLYLARDFGSDAGLAKLGVKSLYAALTNSGSPKAQTFFAQWRTLFGEVCGFDVTRPSERVVKLGRSYGIAKEGLQAAALLFALHTYYALFMKLLASEIVAFFHRLPTPLERLLRAPTSAALLNEMRDLESGSIFRHLHIANFLEGDLFSWYLEAWDHTTERLIRDLVGTLDDYNPGTLSEDPAGSRDLLKHLYQELIPRSVRHDLGEYYTPDWLADHTLNEVGFEGDPSKRLLDPACGSGTFLVLAINRIRHRFEEQRESVKFGEGELLARVLSNVVGFDLNPLAVMAARTNYLIAIRDLISYGDKVELPVYLCDSILTVQEHGGLFDGALGTTKQLTTAAATFVIPTEIATTQSTLAKYADELEHAIARRYSAQEFIGRCRDEGLPIAAPEFHIALFEQLAELDRANRNGVWARIIKNAFAPLFAGKFDFVVGNPPWVNWESLPAEYRKSTLKLWDGYKLRGRYGHGKSLGNVKKELSALFVYACADYYLVPGGTLGFVITQTVLKSGSNEGFRRFRLGPGKPIRVKRVDDLSLSRPFANVTNRTAVVLLSVGSKTTYPLPYTLWVPAKGQAAVAERDLAEVLQDFDVRGWVAAPVEPSNSASPWLTTPAGVLPALQKVIGNPQASMADRAYAGSITWLSGVYWVDVLRTNSKQALIRNLGNVGKKKVPIVEASVDRKFLFPLLRGRDVRAWCCQPAAHILVPHALSAFNEPVSLSVLRAKYPNTYGYLHQFETELRQRSGYKQLHKRRDEFYVVGNIHKAAKSEYKVVFKDLSEVFQCAVVGPTDDAQPVIPDHSLLYVTCDSADEAYFLAGLLNSVPARLALWCSSVGVQTQRYFTSDVARIRVPDFRADDKRHRAIAQLSRDCHEIAVAGDPQALEECEDELGEAVGPMWGLSPKEVAELKTLYVEVRGFRQMASGAGDMDDDTEPGD